MTLDMVGGGVGTGCVGLLSSGGTESIMLAVLAYREYGRTKMGITEPELICGLSAHPAVYKVSGWVLL
jgi:sphinganine-1-phosphate aldolase